MTENEFWDLVNANRARNEWYDGCIVSTWMEEQLSLLPMEELISFQTWMEIAHERIVDSNRIRGAACLIEGCGDDSFDDFGGWVISMGKETYYRVLADADSLAEIGYGEDQDFTRHAFEVVERATGSYEDLQDLSHEGYVMEQPNLVDPGPVPHPDDFDDDEVLAVAYPRIWQKKNATEGTDEESGDEDDD